MKLSKKMFKYGIVIALIFVIITTILENTGVNLDKAWLRIDEFTVDSATNLISDISNYYNGPVNNIPK